MLEALCVWGFSVAIPLKIACCVLGVLTMLIGTAMAGDSFAEPKTCLATILSGVAALAFGLLFPTESAWETLLEIARRP